RLEKIAEGSRAGVGARSLVQAGVWEHSMIAPGNTFTFGNVDARVHRQMLEALPQSAWPPDLELVDRGELTKAEVLLRRQASKIGSIINDPMLLTAAGHQLQPRADRGAIAFCSR